MIPQVAVKAAAEQIVMEFEEIWASYVERDIHAPNRFDALDTIAENAAREALSAALPHLANGEPA